jgi:hypothetical protein
MSREVEVVYVTADPDDGERFRERVEGQLKRAHVVVVESPYRSLVNPFVRYLESAQADHPATVIVVLIPEYGPRHWWDGVLYQQNAHRIRDALIGHPGIVLLDVPYRRETTAPPSKQA